MKRKINRQPRVGRKGATPTPPPPAIMHRYVVEKLERSSRAFCPLWREAAMQMDGTEEQADMGGLSCHLGPCDLGAFVAAESHVRVHGLTADQVCVDVCGW